MFVAFFILDLKIFLSTAAAHFRLYTAPQAVIIKILKQIIIKNSKKVRFKHRSLFVPLLVGPPSSKTNFVSNHVVGNTR